MREHLAQLFRDMQGTVNVRAPRYTDSGVAQDPSLPHPREGNLVHPLPVKGRGPGDCILPGPTSQGGRGSTYPPTGGARGGWLGEFKGGARGRTAQSSPPSRAACPGVAGGKGAGGLGGPAGTPLWNMIEPIFVLDVRDRATGKQVAVRLSRDQALLPVGRLTARVLHAPPEELTAAGRLAPDQADTFFRLQDLIFPVDNGGALQPAPYAGLVWRHQHEHFALDPGRPALFERVRSAHGPDVLVLPVEIDRRDLRYERNWRGFHARRGARFRSLIDGLLREALPDGVALGGAPDERRLVEAAAYRIWQADFENYSRFLGIAGADTLIPDSHFSGRTKADKSGQNPSPAAAPGRHAALRREGRDGNSPPLQGDGLGERWKAIAGAMESGDGAPAGDVRQVIGTPIRLKTGDETVENILAGRGGVCTEKVLALKFITDAFGLESRIVFAGPYTGAPPPLGELRTMLDELDTYDFTYARRFMRYWDHVALEYRLSDGSCWLVDPSNGNIPFVCAPSAPYLDPGPDRRRVPVAMLAVEEPVTYHRVPESLGLDFMFAWETWIGDMDLMQVFDNKLGLLVARDFYVAVVAWGSRNKRGVTLDSWRTYAGQHGLGVGLADYAGATLEERGVFAEFRARLPVQAAWCEAALPGLARRYRAYVLAAHGIDKPFGADLVVLDRRQIVTRLGSGEAKPAAPVTRWL